MNIKTYPHFGTNGRGGTYQEPHQHKQSICIA